MVLLMSMGGPTGLSVNPARDLGPRIAHFLYPIPGKGKSYWAFSGLINLAAFLGAAVGASLFVVLKQFLNAQS